MNSTFSQMPVITISAPKKYGAEFVYILDIIFTEFLGLKWCLSDVETSGIEVRHQNLDGVLKVNSDFFDLYSNSLHGKKTFPKTPLKLWQIEDSRIAVILSESAIPVLFGEPELIIKEKSIYLGIDVFGSAFFMLSGLEEIINLERDNHGRFIGTKSLAFTEGFIDRPLIDEYAEILWSSMRRLWPKLERKKSYGTTLVSCDVDHPFDRCGQNYIRLFKSMTADIIYRHDIALAYRRFKNFYKAPKGDRRFDPLYTFDWYMESCKEHGRQASFYFITDHTAGSLDGDYNIDELRILHLVQNIHERGHEIGIHGSYNSFLDKVQIKKEKSNFISACKNYGLELEPVGNRQHYLRWDVLRTPTYLDSAGYEYDTTGSYADIAGFRYGTAKSFSMWGWLNHNKLRIKQRPLIVMEVSLLSPNYMDLGHTDVAYAKIDLLRKRALMFGGNFSVLWHNSSLLTKKDKALFLHSIQ